MTLVAYAILYFSFKHYKWLSLHVLCIHTKGHSSGEKEINARQPTLYASCRNAQLLSLLLIWNDWSSNEASAIMQYFLEKGVSSTCKLQPIKNKAKLSPNRTPLSRRVFWRLTDTDRNSDKGLWMISLQKYFLAAEERHTQNLKEILIAKISTPGNQKTWQDCPPTWV